MDQPCHFEHVGLQADTFFVECVIVRECGFPLASWARMWAKWRLDLSSPSERFAPRKKDAAAASRCRAMRRSRPRGGNEEDVGVCGDNVEGR